jgi:tripartite-type tricarboxylate transporter receptor subunit TctC
MKAILKSIVPALALMFAGLVGSAGAQFYKGKTVTMIINYPAGGPTDIEGRIVANHFPPHIAGKPHIIVKNLGGGGGMIGTNYLGEVAKPDGETIGFFTWNVIAAMLGDPGLRVKYEDFALIGGVENPLVFYARKDTPPGLKSPLDIMKASGFNALSLNAQNTNTIHQGLALDVLGVKYKPVPGYRGLKDVQTAILQNEGQLANTSLPGWTASIGPTMYKQGVVLPLFQLNAARPDGSIKRSTAIPDIMTFEEFYEKVHGKKPSGIEYETLRLLVDTLTSMFRTVFMPPKTPNEPVRAMRDAFASLQKDKAFLADYGKAVKTEPQLVTGDEGEIFMKKLAGVKPEIKKFLRGYMKKFQK